jgi:hypothetical protein
MNPKRKYAMAVLEAETAKENFEVYYKQFTKIKEQYIKEGTVEEIDNNIIYNIYTDADAQTKQRQAYIFSHMEKMLEILGELEDIRDLAIAKLNNILKTTS